MRSFLRFLVVSVGLLCFDASMASAYVREVTDSGLPVFWRNPCIAMHLYLGAPPPQLTADAYFAAAAQAVTVWSRPYLACTDIRLALVTEPEATADIGYDRKNVVVFRQDTWCRHPPPPQDAAVPEAPCYSPLALAVTTIFRNGKTGELLDTDIEINALGFSWVDLVAHPELASAASADFQFALTHELGHVIGLDHTCFTHAPGVVQLKDNTGALEADCYSSDLPTEARNSIMFPQVSQFEDLSGRRDLTPDDAKGVCEIYPYAHEACPIPDTGCSVSAQAAYEPGAGWRNAIIALAGILGAFLVVPRLRRRKA